MALRTLTLCFGGVALASILTVDDECAQERGEECALAALQRRALPQQHEQADVQSLEGYVHLPPGAPRLQRAQGMEGDFHLPPGAPQLQRTQVMEQYFHLPPVVPRLERTQAWREHDTCYEPETEMEGPCFDLIQQAARMSTHPAWLPQLHLRVHQENPSVCPRPCLTSGSQGHWCSGAPVPKLFAPTAGIEATLIKVLSYNAFWWNLYGVRKGNDNSAGKLILENMDVPFDVMGMQECEHGDWVLEPVGLLEKFAVVPGPHATCMAYNKLNWKLLANGMADVGEDIPTRYYGTRGTQWMRLQHLTTGVHLFFLNHHGPLSINSGGICGGEATAHNLLNVVGDHAVPGDAIVLVGDFNANAGSLTIQTLWRHLVHTFVGTSFGGVDNIFTNVDDSSIVEAKVLGAGGSDHEAISATLQIGGGTKEAGGGQMLRAAPALAVNELTGVTKPTYDWNGFWCGLMEMDTAYVSEPGSWSQRSSQNDPDRCCRACQAEPNCKAWVWRQGNQCDMSSAIPGLKKQAPGVVSGLAYSAAATAAKKASAEAIHRLASRQGTPDHTAVPAPSASAVPAPSASAVPAPSVPATVAPSDANSTPQVIVALPAVHQDN